jgi:uncharacterized protein YceH (UPF0502 family)
LLEVEMDAPVVSGGGRVAQLEAEVVALKNEFAELKRRFEELEAALK